MTAAFAVPANAAPAAEVCQPGLGVALTEIPKGTKDPRATTYVIDRVPAGATFSRRFQVCNGTDAPVTVNLYAGAAEIVDGRFSVIEGRVGNELSSWISISPSRVTLPAGARIEAVAAFAVPADAAEAERYAVLLAELPARPTGNGIAVASRVGVRVYLAVGEGKGPASDFRIESLQASRRPDGRPVVSAVVRNTGARALDLTGELRLTDGPGGLSGGPFPADLGTTLGPGDSSSVTVVLDRAIRGGPWLATLTLKSGLLERRAEATITFPDEAGQETAPVPAKNLPLREDPDVVIPIAIGIFSLAALLLLLALWRRRNKKDEEDQEEEAVPAG
jgi:hypothetical protein